MKRKVHYIGRGLLSDYLHKAKPAQYCQMKITHDIRRVTCKTCLKILKK